MNQPINLKTTTSAVRIECGLHLQVRGFALMALACFAFLSMARAGSPPPDGGHANGNTAKRAEALNSPTTSNSNTANGSGALQNNTTGNQNTASGFQALYSNTTGGFNTATGASALLKNTSGADNTGNGASALFNNTTGSQNTATGAGALFTNTTGGGNTATGVSALSNNNADNNTATGVNALSDNYTGTQNTANGVAALSLNTTGSSNTATGDNALLSNTTASGNTATGAGALQFNTTGTSNTADGFNTLSHNTTGKSNIAVGVNAGDNLTTGNNNIDIGNAGSAGEANHIRIGTIGTQTAAFIAGIHGVPVAQGIGVIVDSNGHLGTVSSSERFTDKIKPMNKASEAILALKPVTFRYKHELDPDGIRQFGLVAEQVEKVNPDLVVRDADGKINTVRYEAVNAMLVNEFLKAHHKIEEQQATITQVKSILAKQEATIAKQQRDFQAAAAQQQKEIEALTAGLQKMSAQVEMSRPAPQMALNKQ